MITVERENVKRLVMVPLPEGPTPAVEGVEYRASCGCVCTFGLRVDNQDKTCGYNACPTHKPYSTLFLMRFTSPDAPQIATELWMAACLDELPGMST